MNGLTLVVLGWVACVSGLDNGLGLLPPLGWNTWCTEGQCGRDVCTDPEIRSIGEAMVESGMQGLGWTYVNMDDCWADHRDANGNIVADPTRFPNGLAPVADYLHSLGLKYGLYTDAGVYTCSSGQRPYKIPGSYGHYQQDASTYASWGMDYIKMDWCNTNVNGTQLQPEIQYAEMSAALNATGHFMYFLSCEWGVDFPWQWMRQFANAWRSGPDHHDVWSSTATIIELNANLNGYAGPGGWNYMDFIMTGGQGCPSFQPGERCPGQTDTEYVTEFSMWVMCASPLIVATDIRNMSAIQKQILLHPEMLALHQDKLAQAGYRIGFDSTCNETLACQLWIRPTFSGAWAVALYNAGEYAHDITFNFSSLGIGWSNRSIDVRDVWAMEDLGGFTDSFTGTNIASHGVQVLKVQFSPPAALAKWLKQQRHPHHDQQPRREGASRAHRHDRDHGGRVSKH